jgi:NDP-sugar pyrophosphorylase family protein
MKTIIICPNQANGIPVLADSTPLALFPLLGESFVASWMHYLACRNFSEVRLVVGDGKELIEQEVGDGSRWGLKIEVFHEILSLSPAEARKRYRPSYESDWALDPLDVIEADHLPGMPEQKLFASYSSWFESLQLWLPQVAQSKRIGFREIRPGVWAGLRTRIANNAELIAPCWMGDNVRIGKNAVVGPNAFLEDGVVLDSTCAVKNSWVGPETFLGTLAELKDSLALGNLLVNWKTASHTEVPDSFLLTSLAETGKRREKRDKEAQTPTVQSALARPFETVISLAQKLQS